MIIRTYDRTYTVIWRIFADGQGEQYLCRSEKEEYTIRMLRDRETYRPILSFFLEQVKKESFTDFRECFVSDGKLYLVFRYSRGPLLAEKLEKETVSEKERAEIARKLLERIVCQDMPWGVLCDALSWDRITVSESLEIRFLYTLNDPEHLAERTKEEAGQILADVLRRILQAGTKRRNDPQTEAFFVWLSAGRFSSVLEIYERFQGLPSGPETSLEPSGRGEPSRPVRALRSSLSGLKKILAAALLAGAFFCLLCGIADYVSPSFGMKTGAVAALSSHAVKISGGFDYIGTIAVYPVEETEEENK